MKWHDRLSPFRNLVVTLVDEIKMKVNKLIQLLEQLNIPPDTTILEYTPRGISVYWSEWNVIYDQRYFDNEDQAVDYFIQLLNNSSPQFKQFHKEHQDMF